MLVKSTASLNGIMSQPLTRNHPDQANSSPKSIPATSPALKTRRTTGSKPSLPAPSPPHRRNGKSWHLLARIFATSWLPVRIATSSIRAVASGDTANPGFWSEMIIPRHAWKRGLLLTFLAMSMAWPRGDSQSSIQVPLFTSYPQQQFWHVFHPWQKHGSLHDGNLCGTDPSRLKWCISTSHPPTPYLAIAKAVSSIPNCRQMSKRWVCPDPDGTVWLNSLAWPSMSALAIWNSWTPITFLSESSWQLIWHRMGRWRIQEAYLVDQLGRCMAGTTCQLHQPCCHTFTLLLCRNKAGPRSGCQLLAVHIFLPRFVRVMFATPDHEYMITLYDTMLWYSYRFCRY